MKGKFSNWLQNVYHIGMLVSLVFILAQVYYARSSMVQTSEWEKAKMTIENIERFREALSISPLSKNDIWQLGDGLWADLSTQKGFDQTDTLRTVFWSLYNNDIDALDEVFRMIEVMDDFAYPIIMGYASETGSYQSAMRQYYTYGNFIMPLAFHNTPLIGIHAKLLYRLWRIRNEIQSIDKKKKNNNFYNWLMERQDRLFCYEATDFTEASLKAYRKKLDGKLKEMQKEIEVFRKNSLK
jgi:hypothetical protein